LASLTAEAIICAVRPHGEHGAIVRALTAEHGMSAGYVRGGRSRHFRPILMAGNVVRIDVRSRTEDQLGGMAAELIASRAMLLENPLSAAAIDWLTSLSAMALPDAQPYPALYAALSATLDAIEIAASARQWAAALARYEFLLLAELGFGLNLSECVVTGATDDLVFVSPKSGGAVSRDAANGYEQKLFPLPAFLNGADRDPSMADVLAGLAITGHFLERDILGPRTAHLSDVRLRLTDRLNRAIA
jgi:DNA repair protein RecO (recombination protein O)